MELVKEVEWKLRGGGVEVAQRVFCFGKLLFWLTQQVVFVGTIASSRAFVLLSVLLPIQYSQYGVLGRVRIFRLHNSNLIQPIRSTWPRKNLLR